MPGIPALRKPRQEDQEFSLSYTLRLCLKKKKKGLYSERVFKIPRASVRKKQTELGYSSVVEPGFNPSRGPGFQSQHHERMITPRVNQHVLIPALPRRIPVLRGLSLRPDPRGHFTSELPHQSAPSSAVPGLLQY